MHRGDYKFNAQQVANPHQPPVVTRLNAKSAWRNYHSPRLIYSAIMHDQPVVLSQQEHGAAFPATPLLLTFYFPPLTYLNHHSSLRLYRQMLLDQRHVEVFRTRPLDDVPLFHHVTRIGDAQGEVEELLDQ